MTKKEERFAIKNKYGGKCAYCGEELPESGWHVDHKEPVYRQTLYDYETGKRKQAGMYCDHNDTFENKIPACASCNINKHQLSVEQFRKLIEGFIHSMNERMVQYKLAKRYGLITETGNKVVFYFEKCEAAST